MKWRNKATNEGDPQSHEPQRKDCLTSPLSSPSRYTPYSISTQVYALFCFFKTQPVQIELPICAVLYGHPLEYAPPTREHILKENGLEFLSWKVSITNTSTAKGNTSWLPLSSMLGFSQAWACTGLVDAVTTALRLCVRLPCCFDKD